MPSVSVIIPTLNESHYLPKLLAALQKQSMVAKEIIIADAGSRDKTVMIAKKNGSRVVPGGMPGVGRNAGAKIATGDIFIFLDADVVPQPDFIKSAVFDFVRRKYAVATCFIEPIGKKLDDQIIMEMTNLYMQVVSSISPRAPGFCILVKRSVHKKIGGFNESLVMCEDHDYAKRASAHGRFGFIPNTRIAVSMRRLEKEGLVQLAFKYFWTELFALTGKPVKSIPFSYEFGNFREKQKKTKNTITDISELRRILGKYSNPVLHFSKQSLNRVFDILNTDASELTVRQIRKIITVRNKDLIFRYIKKRVSIIVENKKVQKSWRKLKSLPDEFIQILNMPI